MGFDLSKFSAPIAERNIGGAPLHFYRFRTSDEQRLAALPPGADAKVKLQTALSAIASRERFDAQECPKPTRVPQEEVEAWGVSDLDEIARLMVSPEHFFAFWGEKREAANSPDSDQELAPIERVGLLVDRMLARHKEATRKLLNAASGSWSGLNAWAKQAELEQARTMEQFAVTQEIFQKQARDRYQELDDAHATAEASIKTASTLEMMAGHFLEFVRRFTAAMDAQQSAELHAIRIATTTFRVSLAVAILATLVAGSGLVQDYQNNQSNDRWQSEVKELLRIQEEDRALRAAIAAEVTRLRTELDALAAAKGRDPKSGTANRKP